MRMGDVFSGAYRVASGMAYTAARGITVACALTAMAPLQGAATPFNRSSGSGDMVEEGSVPDPTELSFYGSFLQGVLNSPQPKSDIPPAGTPRKHVEDAPLGGVNLKDPIAPQFFGHLHSLVFIYPQNDANAQVLLTRNRNADRSGPNNIAVKENSIVEMDLSHAAKSHGLPGLVIYPGNFSVRVIGVKGQRYVVMDGKTGQISNKKAGESAELINAGEPLEEIRETLSEVRAGVNAVGLTGFDLNKNLGEQLAEDGINVSWLFIQHSNMTTLERLRRTHSGPNTVFFKDFPKTLVLPSHSALVGEKDAILQANIQGEEGPYYMMYHDEGPAREFEVSPQAFELGEKTVLTRIDLEKNWRDELRSRGFNPGMIVVYHPSPSALFPLIEQNVPGGWDSMVYTRVSKNLGYWEDRKASRDQGFSVFTPNLPEIISVKERNTFFVLYGVPSGPTKIKNDQGIGPFFIIDQNGNVRDPMR